MRFAILFCFVVSARCSNGSDYDDVSKGPLVTHKVWFDITIGRVYAGRIVIGLFGRTLPKTTRNFVNLAKPRPYEGHTGGFFDYVVKGQKIAGGNRDCDSDYGYSYPKENFKLQHYGAGWLGLVNAGTDFVYSCEFFIILKPLHQFDGKNVIFGKVLNGMKVVEKIADVEVDTNFETKRQVLIVNCGTKLADPPFRVARTAAVD